MFDEINVNGICHCGKIEINARVKKVKYVLATVLIVKSLAGPL